MMILPFDRSKHVYRNEAFAELVKDAVRFFNGTPVQSLPPPESFVGAGVYTLYYIGKKGLYGKYGELNRLAYNHPIYVGKAVPRGWRQARHSETAVARARELYSRLSEHARSVSSVKNLNVSDFMCRFVIFETESSAMIGTIEAALIKLHHPLWNSTLDGFGIHTPGEGRFKQAKSNWDVIHPGRKFAAKCTGVSAAEGKILERIDAHFKSLGEKR
jgi:hypothetical protein